MEFCPAHRRQAALGPGAAPNIAQHPGNKIDVHISGLTYTIVHWHEHCCSTCWVPSWLPQAPVLVFWLKIDIWMWGSHLFYEISIIVIYTDIGVLITSNKYVLVAAGSARCHINGIVKDKLWVTCPNLGVMQCIGLWQPQVIDRTFETWKNIYWNMLPSGYWT
jgi:hypothetical protein